MDDTTGPGAGPAAEPAERADGSRFALTPRVLRLGTRRIMTVTISVGTRFPAYAASMGRVLLAGLDDQALEAYLARVDLTPLTNRTVKTTEALRAELVKVRQQGWALVDQELEIGLRSLAAPIRDARGQVNAAVNISTNASAVASNRSRTTTAMRWRRRRPRSAPT